jgi:hypothetical protein
MEGYVYSLDSSGILAKESVLNPAPPSEISFHLHHPESYYASPYNCLGSKLTLSTSLGTTRDTPGNPAASLSAVLRELANSKYMDLPFCSSDLCFLSGASELTVAISYGVICDL